MKYSLIALAATAICGANAAHHRRHNHAQMFKRVADECACSTYVTTYVEAVTVYPAQQTVTVVPVYASEDTTTTKTNEETSTTVVYQTNTGYAAPTPVVTTVTAPGVYTIPAHTITLTTPVTTSAAGEPTVYAPGTYVQPEITTTITKTVEVITCPYTSVKPAAPTKAPESPKPESPKPESPKPESPKPESPKPEAPKPESPKPETPKTEKPKPKPETPKTEKPKPKPETPKAPAPGGGKYWGITYSPYSGNGGCKSPDTIKSDIKKVAEKGFSNVRVYSTDCGTLEHVGGACKQYGLGIIAGIFLKGGPETGAEQLAALKKWDGWNMVKALIVGNESVFNGYLSASDLANYIQKVRAELKGKYSGPISTTETLNILQANKGALCSAIDFVGVNIQPYFDGGVTADNAGKFVADQLKLARDCCGGKEGYILEAGWPSGGSPNNKAVASPENQAKALKSIAAAVPNHVTFFTTENDLWKHPGNLNIEQKFGCLNVF